jgi:hypothetical protein
MSENEESQENLSLSVEEESDNEDLNLSVNMNNKPIETYREEMRKTNENIIRNNNIFLNSTKQPNDRDRNSTTINNFNININIEKKEPVRPIINSPPRSKISPNFFSRGSTQPIKINEIKPPEIRTQRFEEEPEQDRQPRRDSFHLRKKNNIPQAEEVARAETERERNPSQRHSGIHIRGAANKIIEEENISTRIKHTIIQKLVGTEEDEEGINANIIRLNVQKDEFESDVEEEELFDTIDECEEEVEYDQDFVKDVLLECNKKFIKDRITSEEKIKQMVSRNVKIFLFRFIILFGVKLRILICIHLLLFVAMIGRRLAILTILKVNLC